MAMRENHKKVEYDPDKIINSLTKYCFGILDEETISKIGYESILMLSVIEDLRSKTADQLVWLSENPGRYSKKGERKLTNSLILQLYDYTVLGTTLLESPFLYYFISKNPESAKKLKNSLGE